MALTTVFLELSVLLTIAVVSHFFMKRFRQPTIIGEIAIGIILGPTLIGFAAPQPGQQSTVEVFAVLGAIFLLFILGLESDVRALFRRRNIAIAAGGVLLPWAAGFALAFVLVPDSAFPGTDRFPMAVFVGAALVATSTAIAASILLEMGKGKSEVASTIIGAAVVDDILALAVLSVASGFAQGNVSPLALGGIVLAATLFVVIGTLLGLLFFSRLVTWVHVSGLRLGITTGGFMIAMAVAFLYALVAESIGLSAIIGAFIAGAMFSRTPLAEELKVGAGYLSTVFTPIFFISIGLLVNLRTVSLDPTLLMFTALLVVVAIVTKLVGCGIPARLTGMSRSESVVVGIGMAPRGEMGLVVALAAVGAGVIDNTLFSLIVLAMILVTILPAPFLKRAVKRMEEAATAPT